MRSTLLIAGFSFACVGCGGGRPDAREAAPPAARVVIAQPADGDTVGSDVHFVLQAEGVDVVAADGQHVAGQGHHHLFIDVDPPPPDSVIPAGMPEIVHIGTGASERTLTGLAPGPHRIIDVLAYGDHRRMAGVGTDTVRIVVRQ